MKGKNLYILVVTLIVLAVILAVWQARQISDSTSSTASLSEPAMAASVNRETAEPVELADVFTPDTPIIYCTVKLSNASDTEVKARWIYVGGEAENVLDNPINETSAVFNGTTYLSFALAEDNQWSKGEYKVVLYLNNKEKLSVPFTVQ